MPLSILIWLPVVSGLAGALVGTVAGKRAAGWTFFAGSLVALAISIGYVAEFDTARAGLQWVTDVDWIPELGIHYKLGLDGLNVFLILLTTVLWSVAALFCALREWENPRLFFFHFGLAQTGVLGAFLAQDLALFVAFFDLMLIPFYFLILGWGTGDRRRAATKLFIYTLVGSLLMLAAAVATAVIAANQNGTELSFVLSDLRRIPIAGDVQNWLFLGFAVAFLVKMPSFPFHGWLPDGYKAMPIPVVAVFAAVLSKVAAYGFLRVALPIFPDASSHFQTLLLLVALASILYGSVMAFTQTDTRLIVGYSSIAQLGFITLGIFALRDEGAQGAVLQMINHGIVTAALFFIVGLLAARAGGSEDLKDMGGLAFRAPVLAAFFLIAALANLAMPGSANFVGEFMILLGVFDSKIVIAIVAFTGVVLASVYMLRAFIRTMHNRQPGEDRSKEISLRDGIVVAPLIACIIALAVYPQLALERSQASVRAYVRAASFVNDPSLRPEAPAAQQATPQIDPATGQPVPGGAPGAGGASGAGGAQIPVDPSTGQPVDPSGGAGGAQIPVDPSTGQPVDPSGGAGGAQIPVDPSTGQPVQPGATP